tara:strand:- start:6562 stop:7572 length:1011 start_codon:yes stop_codon:yes gene_type:complete
MVKRSQDIDLKIFKEEICKGNTSFLSQAITLGESTLALHRKQFRDLLTELIPHSGSSIRIGITGTPGAGKSTLIESLGTYLIEKYHKKVAVLAVDPSSELNHGSILGDKTRMELLSRSEDAFIRPSPSKSNLGGVTQNTRESVYLCEAAGYDIILIETVGVGQSEIAVHSMVDFFMILQIVGGGDDLQAIKRGVYEHIDLLVIHKADEDKVNQARSEAANFKKMFALFPAKQSQWNPVAMTCSSKENTGISELWQTIVKYLEQTQNSGYFQKKRTLQNIAWYSELQQEQLKRFLEEHPKLNDGILQINQEVEDEILTPLRASKRLEKLLTSLFSNT